MKYAEKVKKRYLTILNDMAKNQILILQEKTILSKATINDCYL